MKLDLFLSNHFTTNSTCKIVETAQSESKVFSKYGIEFIEKHNDYTHATIVMQWYNEYDLEKIQRFLVDLIDANRSN